LGRPFQTEITRIPSTLEWALEQPLDPSLEAMVSTLAGFPLLVIGSGGSLSGAHFVARVHEATTGRPAKAVSPLEFLYSSVNPATHGVLLLTAGGNNKDIVGSFEAAVQREFGAIGVVCARVDSKIIQAAKTYPWVRFLEYNNPAGKDGFLAVNSLLSTCILVGRAYGAIEASSDSTKLLINLRHRLSRAVLDAILGRKTLMALGGEWAWPAVLDLESKFTEAGLGNVLVADLRNFGHGRHHWFDKKGAESALVVLETPPLAALTMRTLALLPTQYPRTILRSPFNGPMSTIDLFVQVSQLVHEAGKRVVVDPGKPGVPEFGRRIYQVGLASVASSRAATNRSMWLQRKSRISQCSYPVLEQFLDEFLASLDRSRFCGLVFDYDGTICDPPDRFLKPSPAIGRALNDLLSRGIAIAVATGRGRSVQNGLRQVIDEAHWGRVLVGNYNGYLIMPLTDSPPKFNGIPCAEIRRANALLVSDSVVHGYAKIEVGRQQISVTPRSGIYRQSVLLRILELVGTLKNLKVTESDHSIDILHADVSKINVVKALSALTGNGEDRILTVGDQGQYGGNDFDMLSRPLSLSVDRVSSSPQTCWNLSPAGSRGALAAISLMMAMGFGEKEFRIDIGRLERGKFD
jgi:fructoselysine-6-P-deglycase FrlB-like protein